MSRGLHKIPQSWTWATIQDVIIDAQPGFASGKKNVPGGIKHLRMNNISGKCTLDLSKVVTVPTELARPSHILRSGDVLFCHTNSTKLVGKTALFENTNGPYAFSNHLTRLRLPPDGPPPEWLWFWLSTLWRQGYFEMRCKQWVNQATVERDTLLSAPIPVAPIQEEGRIINLVLGTKKQIHNAKVSLRNALDLIRHFRQSVLTKAFRGELIERDPHDEPAHALVERVRLERRRKWEEDLRAKGKDPKKYEYKEPQMIVDGPYTIPTTWVWARLESLVYIAARIGWRGLKKTEYTISGPLFLSIPDIRPDGSVNLENTLHLSEYRYEESPEIRLQNGDLILAKDGATIGKVGYIGELKEKATVNSSLALLRCSEGILPRYLFYYLRGPLMQDLVRERMTGTAVPHLFQRDIREFPVCIPPFHEQKRIVQRINESLRIVEEVERASESAMQKSSMLERSILTQAFSGELLLQDSDDEPASILLDRIRANRTVLGKRDKSQTILEIGNPCKNYFQSLA